MTARSRVRIAGKRYVASPADGGVATLLTSAGWLLQMLPGRVVEEQRPDLLRTLAEAKDLVVEVHTRPSIVLVRHGDRALVKLNAR